MKIRFCAGLGILLFCLAQVVHAQGFVENALWFSRTQPGGSARMQGMGGVQVALGGDFSLAVSNPAGLGMFNRSEVTFTPALAFHNINAEHLSTSESSLQQRFIIPGVSYVMHKPGRSKDFPSHAFAFTFSRTNTFTRKFSYGGRDNLSSIVDWFLERASGRAPEQLPAPYQNIPLLNPDEIVGQSYLTFLINTLADDPGNTNPVLPDDYISYYSELEVLPGEVRSLNRRERVENRGAQNQWTIAYGGNYQDRLFFGASLGIATLTYSFERRYREDGFNFSLDPSYNPLTFLEVSEQISIEGTGLNVNAGITYRPVDTFQAGISFTSPTWYYISDVYTSSVAARWTDSRGLLERRTDLPLISEYIFRTPSRISAAAAWFINSMGFIAADVEWANIAGGRYRSQFGDISFDPENEGIRNSFRSVINYRIGGEVRKSIFRFRAGFNYQANPLKSGDVNYRITTVSTGAGIRKSNFFTDVALMRSSDRTQYSPYIFFDGTGPAARLSRKITSALITVGFTF
jgi:long-subunit fatty acid transport protein